MLRIYFLLLMNFITGLLFGQAQVKKVLFLGNSYIYVNDLPQMLADVALNMGDTVIFDSNTPGGYTLEGHSANAASLSKIMQGGWDYVVLQEQSQRPSFPLSQVMVEVFPYAQFLDSIINQHNPCVETAFYMTWGRKNGDASNCPFWPPVCTYEGMDSLLNLRYRVMADSNDAIISPVGAVWHYIRQQYPGIELYQPDESHPSVAGTYAGACTFYSVLFRRDPNLITFDASLPAADAAAIRSVVSTIAFDSLLNWHVGEYDPMAGYTYQITGPADVTFTNTSLNADSCLWDFGDGDTSTAWSPAHTFPMISTFHVKLVVTNCGISDTLAQNVNLGLGINHYNENSLGMVIHSNPATNQLNLSWNASTNEACTISVLDAAGRFISRFTGIGNETTVDTKALSEGFYIVNVRTTKGQSTAKFEIVRH